MVRYGNGRLKRARARAVAARVRAGGNPGGTWRISEPNLKKSRESMQSWAEASEEAGKRPTGRSRLISVVLWDGMATQTADGPRRMEQRRGCSGALGMDVRSRSAVRYSAVAVPYLLYLGGGRTRAAGENPGSGEGHPEIGEVDGPHAGGVVDMNHGRRAAASRPEIGSSLQGRCSADTLVRTSARPGSAELQHLCVHAARADWLVFGTCGTRHGKTVRHCRRRRPRGQPVDGGLSRQAGEARPLSRAIRGHLPGHGHYRAREGRRPGLISHVLCELGRVGAVGRRASRLGLARRAS